MPFALRRKLLLKEKSMIYKGGINIQANDIIMIVVAVIIIAIVGLTAFLAGIKYRKNVGEAAIGSAEEEARRLINESIKAAEAKSARRSLRQRKKFINQADLDSEQKNAVMR